MFLLQIPSHAGTSLAVFIASIIPTTETTSAATTSSTSLEIPFDDPAPTESPLLNTRLLSTFTFTAQSSFSVLPLTH
ncbi:hypothetical protein M758_UG012900 [Ceratodon purpureus]|nr:hypothetical protein M758_UG012900 [Ceratodon purpureus]